WRTWLSTHETRRVEVERAKGRGCLTRSVKVRERGSSAKNPVSVGSDLHFTHWTHHPMGKPRRQNQMSKVQIRPPKSSVDANSLPKNRGKPNLTPIARKGRPGRPPPMLDSARRHRTSPPRGREVECGDQRRRNVGLHFRSRRSCRRCAFDASQESVGAGSIDVTTTDNSLRIDSVK